MNRMSRDEMLEDLRSIQADTAALIAERDQLRAELARARQAYADEVQKCATAWDEQRIAADERDQLRRLRDLPDILRWAYENDIIARAYLSRGLSDGLAEVATLQALVDALARDRKRIMDNYVALMRVQPATMFFRAPTP